MKKSACVLIADGSEEMEVVICVDVMRRAGIAVYLAGVGEWQGSAKCSRGVGIVPDGPWDPTQMAAFDALVIPGGLGGVQTMRQDDSVLDAIRHFVREGKLVAAICAGPAVAMDAGVLGGMRHTSHPSIRDELTVGTWIDAPVVRDGCLLTSQGPGTAFDFALALVAELDSPETASRISGGMRLWK